jgi:hypothetical protein
MIRRKDAFQDTRKNKKTLLYKLKVKLVEIWKTKPILTPKQVPAVSHRRLLIAQNAPNLMPKAEDTMQYWRQRQVQIQWNVSFDAQKLH